MYLGGARVAAVSADEEGPEEAEIEAEGVSGN